MSSQTLLPLRMGISSCLLGQVVRYDGQHKRDDFICDKLGRYAEFLPVCPEVAIGLGVPRPPIQLRIINGTIHVQGVKDASQDVTTALHHYAVELLPQLDDISGYIFKSRSPSCGLHGVAVYDETGVVVAESGGFFASSLRQALPLLPMAEEGDLQQPLLRENFLDQLFTFHRWREFCAAGMTSQALVDFHRRHKFLLQAHDEIAYRQLGQLVGAAGVGDITERCHTYITALMQALRQPASTGGHVNVLQHIAGFLKKSLTTHEKARLAGLIEDYRHQGGTRREPLAYLQRLLQYYPDAYLAEQYYLNPYPDELLR